MIIVRWIFDRFADEHYEYCWRYYFPNAEKIKNTLQDKFNYFIKERIKVGDSVLLYFKLRRRYEYEKVDDNDYSENNSFIKNFMKDIKQEELFFKFIQEKTTKIPFLKLINVIKERIKNETQVEREDPRHRGVKMRWQNLAIHHFIESNIPIKEGKKEISDVRAFNVVLSILSDAVREINSTQFYDNAKTITFYFLEKCANDIDLLEKISKNLKDLSYQLTKKQEGRREILPVIASFLLKNPDLADIFCFGVYARFEYLEYIVNNSSELNLKKEEKKLFFMKLYKSSLEKDYDKKRFISLLLSDKFEEIGSWLTFDELFSLPLNLFVSSYDRKENQYILITNRIFEKLKSKSSLSRQDKGIVAVKTNSSQALKIPFSPQMSRY